MIIPVNMAQTRANRFARGTIGAGYVFLILQPYKKEIIRH